MNTNGMDDPIDRLHFDPGSQHRPPRTARPTMRDVALLADVSLATVSRVVNGNIGVSPERAARVHHAIALLGYRPDEGARSLRRADGVSESIGLIFEDVSNPFFGAIHRGIEEVARARGVLTFSGSSDNDVQQERTLVDSFGARSVDGLIISPAPGDHAYLRRERSRGTSLVFVDRPPEGIEADLVLSDNLSAGELATSHLIRLGHRRIAFLGDRTAIHTARERLRGYELTLRRYGIDVSPDLIETDLDNPVAAERAFATLLGRRPAISAVIAGQNLITVGVLTALRKRELQHRIAVVGIDDLPLSDVIEPGLTVVAQDPDVMGGNAVRLLFDRIDGSTSPPVRIVLRTRLIRRGSGEIRPTS